MAEAVKERSGEGVPDEATGFTVAMVGAGQLARMTHQAALDLGVRLRVLATDEEEPAVKAGADHVIGSPSDIDALRRVAGDASVITFDHEGVPPEVLTELEAEGVPIEPSPSSKRLAQDKWHARERLAEGGFPLPAHRLVRTTAEVEEFAAEFGWPVVAKAPSGGYDGRGVWRWSGSEDLPAGDDLEGPVLVEPDLDLDLEISVLVARSPGGEIATFPVVETVQREAMCREIIAPARISDVLAADARHLAEAIVEAIDGCGIIAVEMFVVDGALLVNELALRPHNSGHFSIEGCETSQFEQHLRAVLDWPLGSTELTAPAVATVNIVGPEDGSDPRVRVPLAAAVPGAHIHIYDKEPRPGRKLGHVTVRADDPEVARKRALEAVALLEGPSTEAGVDR